VLSVEGAKSAVAFEMLGSGSTMSQAASDLFADFLKGVAPGSSRRAMTLVQLVQESNLTEALASLRTMIQKASLVVVLSPSMLEGVLESFPHVLASSPSVESFFLGADAVPEQDDEGEGDEDEGDERA